MNIIFVNLIAIVLSFTYDQVEQWGLLTMRNPGNAINISASLFVVENRGLWLFYLKWAFLFLWFPRHAINQISMNHIKINDICHYLIISLHLLMLLTSYFLLFYYYNPRKTGEIMCFRQNRGHYGSCLAMLEGWEKKVYLRTINLIHIH